MSNNHSTQSLNEQRATITVVGCGGAGSIIISQLFEEKINNAKLVSLNTDVQHFNEVKSDTQLLIGHRQTRGLGAGNDPDIGKAAANENVDDIRKTLDGSDIVFVVAGLGRGTGTGSAPVVAKVAQECQALTLATVTLPFEVEGDDRRQIAEVGLKHLQQIADTVIVIQNEKLLDISQNLSLHDAFEISDRAIIHSINKISNLITAGGLNDKGFTEVQSVIEEGAIGMVRFGENSSENRTQAIIKEIVHPSRFDIDLYYIQKALINGDGGRDRSLKEIEAIIELLHERIGTKMYIILSPSLDNRYEGAIQILLIEPGIDSLSL